MRIILIFLGLVSGAGSYYFYSETSDFVNSSIVVTGHVIDYRIETKRSEDEEEDILTYYPIIVYGLKEGERSTFRASQSVNPKKIKKGQSIGVRHSSSHYYQVKVNNIKSIWGETIITSLIALILIFAGCFYGVLKQQSNNFVKNFNEKKQHEPTQPTPHASE